ncbi:hypothetical protein [Nocardiopsis lambiniae]|uniref:Uncharacterized protein n=1 Tax=Nocardiopsis lambiniae TaxID=3075539 RepID=A0ABU2M6P4_9ACTN|nr:hypothetical protein [Nocardiopsis sp. DSM 44743]MDT0328337.1 hypothetical protein [Nocardiopsis sp. DSM 44743]
MRSSFTVVALALGSLLLGVVPAHAATGEVVVFTTEFEDVVRYADPASGGCVRLPATAHVLVNLTDTDVRIHAGPWCSGPGVTVEPERGWHAPPSGLFSFSVD